MWNPNEDRMTAWLDRKAKIRQKPTQRNTVRLAKPVVPKLIDVSHIEPVAQSVVATPAPPVAPKPVAKPPFWERPKNIKLLRNALSTKKKKTVRKFYRKVLKEKLEKYNKDNPEKIEEWPEQWPGHLADKLQNNPQPPVESP